MIKLTIVPVSILLFSMVVCASQDDILMGDFEGKSYEDWKVEGTAFGRKPATGTLPGQDVVSGFKGRGLANSFLGGDEATGTLTSPEFQIKSNYINFLIGGGKSKGTRIDLLNGDGHYIMSIASGNQSESLEWASWDTSGRIGKWARLRIVDESTGEHILVDHIYRSDTPKVAPLLYLQKAAHGRAKTSISISLLKEQQQNVW